MSAETQVQHRLSVHGARGRLRWLRVRARVAWRFLTARFSSSLTRRIVVLNLGGLVVLVVGFLLLDQFRADLIEARVQSLTIQADIIAAAISASATGDTDSITIDPDKLLQLAPGESVSPSPSDEDATQFSISPALVGPFLHRLVTPTHTRARIYDSDGRLLLELAIVFGSWRGRAFRFARCFGAARIWGSARRPSAQFVSDLEHARRRRPLGDQWPDYAGSRRRAAGQNPISGARQPLGGNDRVGRSADPAHDGDAGGAAAFHPGR